MSLSAYGRVAGMIGKGLGHYDMSLFCLPPPFFALQCFDKSDPLTALDGPILPLQFKSKIGQNNPESRRSLRS